MAAIAWAVVITLLVVSQTPLAAAQTSGNEGETRINGRLISSYPSSVSGVTVTLTRVDGRESRRTATTDGNGRFTFDRVGAGRYEVAASKPGYTSKRLLETSARFSAGVPITIDAGSRVTNVAVPLRRTASVSGRVIRSNGAAAPGIEVAIARRQGWTLAPIDGTQVVTAWDGRYAFTDLPPGDYLLLATRVARSEGTASAGSSSGESTTSTEQAAFEINQVHADDFVRTLYPGVPATDAGESVTLLEGISADGIDIWLAPARRFSVSGRVFGPEGSSVENITIEYGNPSDRQSNVWTVSDPGGLFTVDGVPPGPVVLLAAADSNTGRLLGITSTDVRAADVQDVSITLVRPGELQGRVTFAPDIPADARPTRIVLLPKALNVSPLYARPEAALGADGSFRLTGALGEYEFGLPDLPAGLRITSVTRNGYTLPGNRIGVNASETTTDIVVTISRGR